MITKEQLKEFVQQNPELVSMKESKQYPGLYVLKYKARVFYDALWNEFLEECRGTVIDADFNVVSRPFTKIYNYGVEDRAPKLLPSTKVTAFRKVNGFMAAVTLYKGEMLVSTTGSLDSDFVAMAKELFAKYAPNLQELLEQRPNRTFMFECVHRNDPHIVPEVEGVYLLGYRYNSWDSVVKVDPLQLDMYATFIGTTPVEHMVCSVGFLLQAARGYELEGFVFYTDTGIASKIKSTHYLVLKAAARKKDILSLDRRKVDEEYYPLIDHLKCVYAEFNKMSEQERLAYITKFLAQLAQ